MSKDEFVEFHGEEAWNKIVGPWQQGLNDTAGKCDRCYVERCNANLLWHITIKTILELLGYGSDSLLKSREDKNEKSSRT